VEGVIHNSGSPKREMVACGLCWWSARTSCYEKVPQTRITLRPGGSSRPTGDDHSSANQIDHPGREQDGTFLTHMPQPLLDKRRGWLITARSGFHFARPLRIDCNSCVGPETSRGVITPIDSPLRPPLPVVASLATTRHRQERIVGE
jgi:hypothetical protein